MVILRKSFLCIRTLILHTYFSQLSGCRHISEKTEEAPSMLGILANSQQKDEDKSLARKAETGIWRPSVLEITHMVYCHTMAGTVNRCCTSRGNEICAPIFHILSCKHMKTGSICSYSSFFVCVWEEVGGMHTFMYRHVDTRETSIFSLQEPFIFIIFEAVSLPELDVG